jgi:hypothetical protein
MKDACGGCTPCELVAPAFFFFFFLLFGVGAAAF